GEPAETNAAGAESDSPRGAVRASARANRDDERKKRSELAYTRRLSGSPVRRVSPLARVWRRRSRGTWDTPPPVSRLPRESPRVRAPRSRIPARAARRRAPRGRAGPGG